MKSCAECNVVEVTDENRKLREYLRSIKERLAQRERGIEAKLGKEIKEILSVREG